MRMPKSNENSPCVVLVTCYSDSLLKRLQFKKIMVYIPVYWTIIIGKCDTYIIITLLYFYKIIYINKSYFKISILFFGFLIGHITYFRQ